MPITKKPNIRMVKPMQLWMKKYDIASKQQGWSLFDADGTILIQKIDDMEENEAQCGKKVKELASDQDALNLIVVNASKGDKMSLIALYFDGRPVNEEVDLPKSLR